MPNQNDEEIPRGFVRMQPGELLTEDTFYWYYNRGPWMRYGDGGFEIREDIGSPLDEGCHAHIRRETHAEFLRRTGFESELSPPPAGYRWLEETETIPTGARVVIHSLSHSTTEALLRLSVRTCRAGRLYDSAHGLLRDRYLVPLVINAPIPALPMEIVSRRPPRNIRRALVSPLPLP